MTDATPIASLADWRAWLAAAAPGDVAEYHRGCLASARGLDAPEARRRTASALGDAAWQAADAGHLELAQRRIGFGRWAYLAQRTRLPLGRSRQGSKAPLGAGSAGRVAERVS